jgi:peroxiredoxin Q/BCP
MGIIRSSFLVDEEGRIAEEWRKVKAKEHADWLLEKLRA